jgi:streptomycin 6-kinase
MAWTIPKQLAANCRKTPERTEWLTRLPGMLRILESRWSLKLSPPFENVSCAWVARATGLSAVLKLGMPHMEGEHEIQGLRFWDGNPTVRLLDADENLGAMLLESCEPGSTLRELPEPEQDVIIAALLRRLWQLPPEPHPFRPLSALMEHWSTEALADIERWPDSGLVREGLNLFRDLPLPATADVLLATDLHSANVLRSEREPWLVIDPKPFVGDQAYDATQHLFNCEERLRLKPIETIHRMADLLGVDRGRVRQWMFARAAAGPRSDWEDSETMSLARAIA